MIGLGSDKNKKYDNISTQGREWVSEAENDKRPYSLLLDIRQVEIVEIVEIVQISLGSIDFVRNTISDINIII